MKKEGRQNGIGMVPWSPRSGPSTSANKLSDSPPTAAGLLLRVSPTRIRSKCGGKAKDKAKAKGTQKLRSRDVVVSSYRLTTWRVADGGPGFKFSAQRRANSEMRETMAKDEECAQSQKPKSEDGEKSSTLFSPGFRSVAAMAGWDEEALLMASLVVEDTPDRNPKHKKRTSLLNSTTPSTNSRRKRRAQIRVTVLDLDDEVECEKKETGGTADSKKGGNAESKAKEASPDHPPIPCSIDKLREELSCAIFLEICFEPSTTPCGDSFCKKCLRSAADKCGKKCPKCRQLISNGRSCTVNTVLWNTIQLLFPQEVEARKASIGKVQQQSPARTHHHNSRNRRVEMLNNNSSPEAESEQPQHQSLERANTSRSRVRRQSGRPSRGDFVSVRPRRELPSQDEDSALALRLQREEFMAAFRDDSEEQEQGRRRTSNYRDSDEEQRRRTSSLAVARANLRAMASRAINIRTRSRGT
nr:LON peptidase N-terminal domain and RING finger protein 3-like [Ipomoea batatas]